MPDSSTSASAIDIGLALVRRNGCYLITRRKQGTHLAGYWEFPGGKCAPGEYPDECAVREALEEVGVGCRAVRTRPPIVFAYPERTVRLYPVECEYLGGGPRPIEVADFAWVVPKDLANYEFPPANAGLISELIREG